MHIGYPKTGTTALQRSLLQHDSAIAHVGKLGRYSPTPDQYRCRVQRYRGRNRVRHLGQWIDRWLHRARDPTWVELTDAIRERVMATYADSNCRLSRRLERDLGSCGHHECTSAGNGSAERNEHCMHERVLPSWESA